jgi:hypothetical protein
MPRIFRISLLVLACLLPATTLAALTPAQSSALKAAIQADPTLNALPNEPDSNAAIADAFNAEAAPAFWVLRSSVREAEYTAQPSVDGTVWSWPAYIARSQGERDAWGRMFAATGTVNPSLPNVQQAFADIFSGTAAAPVAQRAHLTACSRRKATRIEKLYATGTGSAATPATMGREGPIGYEDVEAARKS